jgi:uncharacterized membrane protein YgcG
MSTSASISRSQNTSPMVVANMTFMLERLAQDCAPLQFVRELTQNSIDSIKQVDGQHGEIRWDVDWNLRELDPANKAYKLAIIDTGVGMTGREMLDYINKLSSSIHEQSTRGNFGMGAKISAAPMNPSGLLYLSWKDGKGSMIHLWKDPESNTYGLKRFPNGEFWVALEDTIKPEPIESHGTMVVLLGKDAADNTANAPQGALIPSRWILRYLNTRYFRFPASITVKARENWHLPRADKRRNSLRRVVGQQAYLQTNNTASGTVDVTGAKVHWWILKSDTELDQSGHNVSGGHVAALYDDELYEMVVGRSGITRLQLFGVIFGYNRVVLYVEPSHEGVELTANTARTQLLIDNQTLPWADWATEFRNKMPAEITSLMEEVAHGAANSENSQSIRERLKQIKELFRFSRYRANPDGSHTIDEELATGGGNAAGSGSSGGRSGGGGGSRAGGGGNAGDIYALFAATNGTPAEEISGLNDPRVRWVSMMDGTRSKDDLDDKAAKYLQPQNTILANADFRVFTDMMARWKKIYGHVPSAIPVVESVVKEWFQQQLVEAVLGALALRRSGGNWSEDEIAELWSETALTAAVLPRYHVDQSIKRALGSKLGTTKDKDAG